MGRWQYLQCIPLSVLMLSGCSVDDLLVRRHPKESPQPTYNTVEMNRHNELEAENIRLRTQNTGLQAEVERLQGQVADAERPATAAETKLQSSSASYRNIQPMALPNAKVETIQSYSPGASTATPSGYSAGPARSTSSSKTTYTPSYPRTSGYSGGGYIRGPRGGCYTYSASGRKRYVDRSLCN